MPLEQDCHMYVVHRRLVLRPLQLTEVRERSLGAAHDRSRAPLEGAALTTLTPTRTRQPFRSLALRQYSTV